MSRHAYLRRARHWIANRGWRGFVAEISYRLKLKAQGKPTPGRESNNPLPHPFDLAYGTETDGLVWGESLERPSDQAAAFWATGYYGISPSAFTSALERLQLEWSRFSFIDIGCGKGRAMLLASRFPFNRILGVELSLTLAAAAKANLSRFRAPWRQPGVPLDLHQGDATTFPFPAGPLVLFLYHPFAAPVMRQFLAHVRDTALKVDREIVLLYANPELASLLEATPGVQPLWRECFELTTEEGAADRFGSHGETFIAYRVKAAATAASRSRQTR